MQIGECHEESFSLNMFVAGAALLGSLAVPLSVAAFNTASQACKDCVMKGVMQDGKLFRECLRPNLAYPAGVCDSLCINVDQNALRKELKEQASAQCVANRKSCMQATEGDRNQMMLCEAAYNYCLQRLNGFNDFH